MDKAVVAKVRPAVVHVEHGDIDDLGIGGRQILRPFDADVVESAAGRVGGAA
jgi:hypothetical protein